MINNITDILKENMMVYSSYVIQNRILPAVEDGMKPVHRRIVWAMNDMGATKFTKSANVTGEVMKIHPHGSTYSTIVNMVQTDNQNIPLIVGKGNFAQHTSKELKPASERYTEIKLSDIAKDILDDVKNNMIDFIPNYDNNKMIPQYLPTKFPLLLAYTTSGIGVGISTSIPSYNINELCDATIKYIQTKEKTILYPDFACGGLIVNDQNQFENIINTGKGVIKLRAKCEVVGNNIIITEIPYTTSREDIIEKIIQLVKEGKLKEVNDVKDLTGLTGMKIEVSCKRGTNMDVLKEKLYKLTTMESNFNVQMNVLTNGTPKLLSFYEIIDEWYIFRKNCIIKYLKNKICNLEKELNILDALKLVLLDIDKAIQIIRSTDVEPVEAMCKYFNINTKQADYICNMKLKNINKDYIIKQLKDIDEKREQLEFLQNNINNNKYLKQEVIKGIEHVAKQFKTNRKTNIVEPVEISIQKEFEEKMIEDYDVTLYLTKEGYFKKVRYQRGQNKLKAGDDILYEITASNKDEVIFFGSDGNCYKYRLSDLEDNQLNTLGTYIVSEIGCDVLGMSVIKDEVKFLLFVYDNRVAKIDINAYKTTNNRKQLKNSLYDNSLLYVYTLCDDTTIELNTAKGKQKKIDTSELVTKASRNSQGIRILQKDKFIM